MSQQFCYGCMRVLQSPESVCPVCGYRHGQEPFKEYVLPPGTLLHGERYLVGKVLGQGGFGITYLGYDCTLERKVAIKEFFPMGVATRTRASTTLLWQGSDQELEKGKRSFLKEARKMAKAEEIPGIVRVREFFAENNTAYIIMGFIEGDTLKSLILQGGPMEQETCLALLMPVMQALEKAHQTGLIHRDISPDNIMVDHYGQRWLLDMGAAKDTDLAAGEQSQTSQAVIKRGYSPPEQYIDRSKIGPWTDVYAMCATICYCLNGKLLPDAMERLYSDKLQLPSSASAPLSRILSKGLALRYEQRIQSMNELISALEKISRKPEPKPSSTPSAKREALNSRAIGLDLRDGYAYVSAFRNGRPEILFSLETHDPVRAGIFLNSARFGSLLTEIMSELHRRYLCETPLLFLSVPDTFGYSEYCRLQETAAQAGLRISRFIGESAAAAVALYHSGKQDKREAIALICSQFDADASFGVYCTGDGVVESMGTMPLEVRNRKLLIPPASRISEMFQLKGNFWPEMDFFCLGSFRASREPTEEELRTAFHVQKPARIQKLKEDAVSKGLAVLSGAVYGSIRDILLLDTTPPYDLCASFNDTFYPMIDANTSFPTLKIQEAAAAKGSGILRIFERRENGKRLEIGSCVTEKSASDSVEIRMDIDASKQLTAEVSSSSGALLGRIRAL